MKALLLAGIAGLLLVAPGCSSPPRNTEAEPEQSAAPRPPDDDYPRQRQEFERLAERLERHSRFFSTARSEALAAALNRPALSEAEGIELLVQLVLALLEAGDPDQALARANEALALVDGEEETGPVAALHRLRALVHLRRAEVGNCIRRHNPDCCIFPLRGRGVHEDRGPATAARNDYLRVLEIEPDNLMARWLLNIVAMALGEHPDGVPERFRIPVAAFGVEADVGRFRDVAGRLGLDTFDLCGGSIVEDLDNDGYLDVVTSTLDPRGPMTFHRSLGDGRFENRSSASRLDDQLGGLNALAADYDNDGFRDILVLRGAWLLDEGRIRNSLLHNDGDGTFRDVTRQAGLAEPAYPTQAAAWGDFDADGNLDLFVGNESRVQWDRDGGDFPSQMFRNNGDGSFTDIAAAAGVTNDRYAKGVTVGDYDDDGDLDLYVSNNGPNRLYRNDGNLAFTDVAEAARVIEPRRRSFACWFFDYDNDGRLDLFVGAYEAGVADVAADVLGLPNRGKLPRLYRNRGDATFDDVTAKVGLDHVYLPMGANFGDLDNDGWLDIYLGTGEPDYQSLMPNVMLRNDRGRRFLNVTVSGGFGHLQKGHGIAFADLDNDGDQDIHHQLGGFYPGDRFRNALFENPGHGNRFVTLKLIGSESNRDALGARISVTVESPAGPATFHRAVGSVSSFGGSPVRQEIGLGDAAAIERIEIVWPRAGRRTVLTGVPLDSFLRVVEGRQGYEVVEPGSFGLGGEP